MINQSPTDLDVDYSGYDEAVARENAIRGAACLGINETICGLEVRAMSAAHVRLLTLVNSPFMRSYTAAQLAGTPEKDFKDGKPGIVADIMLFLWIVSPMYETGSVCGKQVVPPPCPKRKLFQSAKNYRRQIASIGARYAFDVEGAKTARDRFNEAFAPILKQPVDKVCAEILNYVEEAYTDAEEGARSTTSYYAFETSVAHELATHYPNQFRIDFWNPDCPREKNPIHAPLKIVFQLRKLRTVIEQGTKAVTNKSDRELEKALQRIAARLNSKKETASAPRMGALN